VTLDERIELGTGGEDTTPRRPRRSYARPVLRGDDEGLVMCECPGCGVCRNEEHDRPALYWFENAREAIQLCGTCANRRTDAATRHQFLRRLDDEEGAG
jgi:hypothetical protein